MHSCMEVQVFPVSCHLSWVGKMELIADADAGFNFARLLNY